jgi:hypothetical protein
VIPKIFGEVQEDPRLASLAGTREAWRCDACRALMYDLEDGKPTEGAPMPHYLSDKLQNVCSLCFQMGSLIKNSMYWKRLSDEHEKRFGQLKSDGNYFPGAF